MTQLITGLQNLWFDQKSSKSILKTDDELYQLFISKASQYRKSSAPYLTKANWSRAMTWIRKNESTFQCDLAWPKASYAAAFSYYVLRTIPSLVTNCDKVNGEVSVLYEKLRNREQGWSVLVENINGIMHIYLTLWSLGSGCFKEGKAVFDLTEGKFYAFLITKTTFSRTPRKMCSDDAKHEGKTLAQIGNNHYCVEHHAHGRTIKYDASGSISYERSVMVELCESTFEDYLREKKLYPEEIISLLFDFAKGLNSLHAENKFHLDIKPDNVLVKDRCGKIADFGCSVTLDFSQPETEEQLKTSVIHRRNLHKSDQYRVLHSLKKYKEARSTSDKNLYFQSLASLLDKIDSWMFYSLIEVAIKEIESSFGNTYDITPLKILQARMSDEDIDMRPSMTEVSKKLSNLHLTNKWVLLTKRITMAAIGAAAFYFTYPYFMNEDT